MALIILGLVAGLATVGWRLVLERDFNQVEIALDLQDLIDAMGSGTEAPPLDGLLPGLYDLGVQSFVLTVSLDEPWDAKAIAQLSQVVRDAGGRVILKIGSDGEAALLPGQRTRQAGNSAEPNLSAMELASLISITEPEVILVGGSVCPGYPNETPKIADLLHSQGIRFGLQEFAEQAGEAELARLAPSHIVRVHTIYPKELPRYNASSAEARFIRAVRERSYRLLYVRVLPDDDAGTALESTVALIKGIDTALGGEGYVLGPASALPPWQTGFGTFLLVLGGWLGASLMLWMAVHRGALAGGLSGQRVHSANRLILVGLTSSVLLMLACYVLYEKILARQVLALLIAITFPTWAALPQRWSKGIKAERPTKGQALALGLGQFAVASGISLTGAFMVVAALGDYRFMLKVEQFRGVKAMSLLPIGLVGIGVLLKALQVGMPSDWRQHWRDISIWSKAFLLLVAIAGIVIYVGRTGNFVIPVPNWEVRLREALENALPYRPRTKEMLIGHPLFVLGLGLYGWGWRRLGLWTALIGSVGQISMINTFAHIHSSVTSALSRTFSGLLLGAMLGCLLFGVAVTFLDHVYSKPSKAEDLPPRGRLT